jgi:hypothetical protein
MRYVVVYKSNSEPLARCIRCSVPSARARMIEGRRSVPASTARLRPRVYGLHGRHYDDTSLDVLWKLNIGTGFDAPLMSFEAGGEQYVAILSGLTSQGLRP